MKKHLLSDGLWVMLGQLSSAIGTLVGLRALTEYAPPSLYGTVTLFLALGNLALGTLFTPIMQAAIKFYSHYENNSQVNFRHTTSSILRNRLLLLLTLLTLAWPIINNFQLIKLDEYVLLIILFITDGIRTFETVLLNAARKQKTYAIISALEAWGRPFFAILVILSYGATTRSILLGYICTTLLIILSFYLYTKPVVQAKQLSQQINLQLKHEITKYALPLLPLATVGWISGVGDRYIIAAILGTEEVGIYAAVYGLLNRPFLMLGNIIELTLRPIYNQSISAGYDTKAYNIMVKWLVFIVCSSLIGWTIITLFKSFWISLFLGPSYQQGVLLMPWIAGGSALLIISHVFEKVCYGYGRTGLILLTQTIGACLGLAIAYIGILHWGLLGAAVAAPIYFGIQLLIAIAAAHSATTSITPKY